MAVLSILLIPGIESTNQSGGQVRGFDENSQPGIIYETNGGRGFDIKEDTF